MDIAKEFCTRFSEGRNLKLRHEINGQRDEFKIRIEKLQVVNYVDKVFSLVQEAAEKKRTLFNLAATKMRSDMYGY